jgi:hypothetical protein
MFSPLNFCRRELPGVKAMCEFCAGRICANRLAKTLARPTFLLNLAKRFHGFLIFKEKTRNLAKIPRICALTSWHMLCATLISVASNPNKKGGTSDEHE